MRTLKWCLRTAVLVSLLPCLASGAAVSAYGTPEPVSPGRTDRWAVIAERCPTFSWSAVPSAWAYEIAVYPATEVAGERLPGTEAAPLLHVEIPAAATSWTPSLDQCLSAGQRYVWFIREKGPFGRPDGDWSRASSFRIDATGMVDPDWDQLLKQLDELQRKLDALRNDPDAVDSLEDEEGPLEKIQNAINEITTKINEILGSARNLATTMATQVANLTGDIRDSIADAIAEVKAFVIEQKAGLSEFLGSSCDSSSPCGLFRASVIQFLNSLTTIWNTLINLNPASATTASADGSVSTASFTSLIAALQNVPGVALYPLYRGLSVESNALDGSRMVALAQNLTACLPAFRGDCSQLVAGEATFAFCATAITGTGVTLKLLGKFADMLGETHLDSKMGVHGYPGIVIKNNRLKKIGALLGGVSDGLGQVSAFITGKLRHCLVLSGQDDIDSALSAHDAALSTHNTAVAAAFVMLHNRLNEMEQAARRLAIDQNLAMCRAVVSHMLPAAAGGELESVVERVQVAIGQAALAGISTSKAVKHLDRANQEISARRYDKAFNTLCKAYRAIPGDGDDD